MDLVYPLVKATYDDTRMIWTGMFFSEDKFEVKATYETNLGHIIIGDIDPEYDYYIVNFVGLGKFQPGS